MGGEMSELVVKPVVTRRERKAFLEFPWTLYRGDPNWIPPLSARPSGGDGGLNRRHPFYERNTVATFWRIAAGRCVGGSPLSSTWGHRAVTGAAGFFQLFECRDDPQAADGLFDACRTWFADKHARLRGPANPR